ncbi:hypothetical protein LCGC14_2246090 [marine sediment metagenome]|uniref:Uncharacterized protein n=1 Tax=marine sediment metagenome TaxID=412755 RepID=A0A0F9DRJ1_9ZZZZ
MNFLQQAIVNIHVANNIKAVSTVSGAPEFPALIYDKTKQLYGQYPPTNTAEYLTLYGKIAPVYNAVSVKARTIAQLPIQILKQTGDKEFEDVTDTRAGAVPPEPGSFVQSQAASTYLSDAAIGFSKRERLFRRVFIPQ